MRHCLLISFAAVLLIAPAVFAERVLDDFETYKDGQIVGPSATSAPWRRFGRATIDNVVATRNVQKVIEGKVSGQYVVRWPASFGSARYQLDEPLNLRQFHRIAIDLRSDRSDTRTRVRLSIDDGKTSFLTKQRMPVTDAARSFAAVLDRERFERVAGKGSFGEVIERVRAVGFNVYNPKSEDESEVTETLIFDALRLLNSGEPLPEQDGPTE